MLDEVGVAYEVLDASRQMLTPEFLSDGYHGKFNGVILTDSMLYYTGPGNELNSAFSRPNGRPCISTNVTSACVNPCYRGTRHPALFQGRL
ncbi:MAG: hypothetical protein IPM37_12545 [Hahellaceae bacterium]|nr:hypothetical protein [Hahellaceae bacterium]